MNTEKAIDKIRKLLALASSDNASEAENALLAARRLMAEHKLTERDVADAEKPGELHRLCYEEHTVSGLKNSWMIDLAQVIADNHCCAFVMSSKGRSTVHRVWFTGLGDDPAIALELFGYAVHHILHRAREYRENELGWLTVRQLKNEHARAFENSYAEGFTAGLAAKYAEQFGSEETALVLVQPVEVKQYLAGLAEKTLTCRRDAKNDQARAQGYKAGYDFNPTKQIANA